MVRRDSIAPNEVQILMPLVSALTARDAIYMARTYGPDEMERIRKYAYEKGNQYSREELEEIIQKYTLTLKRSCHFFQWLATEKGFDTIPANRVGESKG